MLAPNTSPCPNAPLINDLRDPCCASLRPLDVRGYPEGDGDLGVSGGGAASPENPKAKPVSNDLQE